MRLATRINYAGDFAAAVDRVVALEAVGLDIVWVPEVYGFDAATQLGYLAAKTTRVHLASGILPIYSRTPALIAMTAAGLDDLSGGRAILGLGASGPQVDRGLARRGVRPSAATHARDHRHLPRRLAA